MSVVALWAHPRSVSTAFLRMMAERGDVTVVHEPLVLLTDHGEVTLPALPGAGQRDGRGEDSRDEDSRGGDSRGGDGRDEDGGPVTVRSAGELMAHLSALGAHGPVFFKDTLEYRFTYLFEHPEAIAGFRHTFLVRDPAPTIASHHAVKPDFACHEVGYEHQWELFRLAWRTTGEQPVVITAERLLTDPPGVVAGYCAAVGLPYRPEALSWQPRELPAWEKTRRWHLDASASSGFRTPDRAHPVTVDNDPRLRAYYDHHLPFYERLVAHAL